MKETNQALLLKNVWKIASAIEAPWVAVLKAKYCPNTGFWPTTRTYRCSSLWRSLVILKPSIQHHLVWKIGDGTKVFVYSQPWYPGWNLITATTAAQRTLTVASLIDPETHSWDFEVVQSHLGIHTALRISLTESIAPVPPPAQDTLLFTFANDGKFTTKRAYQMLKGDTGNAIDKKFWGSIWKAKGLSPKLKLFLWRCINQAIPVRGVLGARIATIPTTCQLCNHEVESIEHALFTCDFAKEAWWASELTLRSDQLQGDFRQIIAHILGSLTETEVSRFVCMTWAIWRIRNDAIMEGKKQDLNTCFRYYQEILLVRQTRYGKGLVHYATNPPQRQQSQNLESEGPICYVDGSWSADALAGVGVIMTVKGVIIQWISKRVNAMSPTHAEAIALLEGYKLLHAQNYYGGTVFSDSLEVVDSVGHNQPVIHDWRSFKETWEAWQMQNQSQGQFKSIHCNREEMEIQVAHRLANLGRIEGWQKIGQGHGLTISQFLRYVGEGMM